MMSLRLSRLPAGRIAFALLLLAELMTISPLRAAPQLVVDAEDLDLSVPCLARFDIMVDPALNNGVSIDSSTTSSAHLTLRTGKTQGASKVLITSRNCAPNARGSILVAPNVGVTIHDSHDTHIVIHGTLASLEASLEAGQLDADTIQSLDLSLRGTEQVHIAHLNRAAQVVETGTSGLTIDHADLDAFSAQLSENSHLTVANGRFDALTLMVENAASAQLSGTANTATVAANSSGAVIIPTVSGILTRTGNVQIGPVMTQSQPPAAAQETRPSISQASSAAASSGQAISGPMTPPAVPHPPIPGASPTSVQAAQPQQAVPAAGQMNPARTAPSQTGISPSGASHTDPSQEGRSQTGLSDTDLPKSASIPNPPSTGTTPVTPAPSPDATRASLAAQPSFTASPRAPVSTPTPTDPARPAAILPTSPVATKEKGNNTQSPDGHSTNPAPLPIPAKPSAPAQPTHGEQTR